MSNRFLFKKNKDYFLLREVIFPVATFIAALIFLRSGVFSISVSSQKEQLNAAKQAVINAAVQCYALEGRYPPSVDYLRNHYGLQVDADKYIVHYSASMSNRMPDIDVIPLVPVKGLETEEERDL